MSYKFFNPNPLGKRVGDCVIRAISFLTGDSWQKIYIGIALKGFEMFDMPSSNAVWAEYLKERGYQRVVIPDTCPQCYSVREFCLDNPHGDFLLATGSHVVAVSDGDYYDAWDSGAEIPIYYWRKDND